MPEENEKTSIELLPEKKFEEYSLSKKLTTWVISVGRVVIIFTELIAFSVFIGRIKLDRELTDLTNALENQLIVLENAKGFEEDFRDLQGRLKIIKDLRQEQVPVSQTVSLFSTLLPSEVSLTSLTFQPPAEDGSGTNEAYLLAQTSSTTGFAQTIHNLKNSPKVEDITLTSGRFGAEDGMYHFSLAIKLTKHENMKTLKH